MLRIHKHTYNFAMLYLLGVLEWVVWYIYCISGLSYLYHGIFTQLELPNMCA